MHNGKQRARALPALLALLATTVACAGGARVAHREPTPGSPVAPCPSGPAGIRDGEPLAFAYVLHGRVLARHVQGAARPPELTRLGVDDIFNMEFISDTAAVARYGLCPGVTAIVITTVADARRRGLQPPLPKLCLRSLHTRHPPRLALPVGAHFQVAAGQLDFLDECDRPAPPDVHWTSSDPRVLEVDSTGIVHGRAPGRAEVIAAAGGVTTRLNVTVVPPVQHIAITPADTAFAVGDTITFRATAYGVDGQPMPGVSLDLSAHGNDASSRGGVPPAIMRVWAMSPAERRPHANTLRVRALREGAGYVVAAMIGRADSVRGRVIAR